MTIRTTIAGICMLCALALCAVAAQSAAAATGTTSFTCNKTPTGEGEKFSDSHCKTTSPTGEFRHVGIAQDTTTEITGTAETTGGELNENRFKATVAGIPVELRTKEVHVTGGYENNLDVATKEHYVHGHKITVTYTNVVVAIAGNTTKCRAQTDSSEGTGEFGVIHTRPLTATSTEKGDKITLKPENAGEPIATFDLADVTAGSCPAGIKGTYTVSGSITGVPNGATINYTHASITETSELILNGAIKSGYEGSVTIKGKDPAIPEDTLKPLGVTTVTT